MKSTLLTPLVLLALGLALLPAKVQADDSFVEIADWCSIQAPAEVTLGKRAEFTIKVTGLEDGMKVHLDLHYRRVDGSYGGFNAWGGESQDVPSNGILTFRATPKDKEGIVSVIPILFVSPTGEHEDRVAEATAPEIPVKR